ncbi:hypothetical protein K402DRAFT_416109 [Aulographum hederae CBS 113979]|uniref:Cyclin-dependent kinase n=1 Tax=Aulographum hederae CBS 113979 TaxID=1176131 RepID=A0A6G1HHN2_9PEZI|nr:hypothetical protein K402DRAFT_416109 [Aulographum hederae CBS 113979]
MATVSPTTTQRPPSQYPAISSGNLAAEARPNAAATEPVGRVSAYQTQMHPQNHRDITASTVAFNSSGPNPEPETASNSQQSYISSSSLASSGVAPRLQSSSSNLSTSTAPETDRTSPTSSVEALGLLRAEQKGLSDMRAAEEVAMMVPRRPTTPRLDADARVQTAGDSETSRESTSVESPMSVDTPQLHHGAKRTASGAIKLVPASFSMPVERARSIPHSSHSRNVSTDTTASRASELSALLKSRLSYAMVKVQNGWENHSISELEEHIATANPRRPSNPSTPNARFAPYPFATNSARRRRSSQSTDSSSEKYMHSPGLTSPHQQQPTPHRRNMFPSSSAPIAPQASVAHPNVGPTSYASFWATQNPNQMPSSSAPPPQQFQKATPSLAPAADIIPTSRSANRRSISTRAPPMLSSSIRAGAGKSQSDLGPGGASNMATPRTRGILRMPSQQAEKDAVDTLLFLSSPNHSGKGGAGNVNGNGNGMGVSSPLKSEFGAAMGDGAGIPSKKVGFGDVNGGAVGRSRIRGAQKMGVIARAGSEEDSEGELVVKGGNLRR